MEIEPQEQFFLQTLKSPCNFVAELVYIAYPRIFTVQYHKLPVPNHHPYPAIRAGITPALQCPRLWGRMRLVYKEAGSGWGKNIGEDGYFFFSTHA